MHIDTKRIIAEFNYGQPISLAGITIGSDVNEIPFYAIERSLPELGTDLTEKNGHVFRKTEDGEEQEVSAEECYQLVKQRGGWLFSECVTWKIKSQAVKHFCINNGLLAQFKIDSEAKIIEYFGRPECILINGIGMEYHYMSRKLKILWAKRESRLYSVDVGDFTASKKIRLADAENGVFYIGKVRRVTMTSLEQVYAYGGMISGSPTLAINDLIIEEIKNKASKKFSGNKPIHFIEPKRTDRDARDRFTTRTKQNIPGIACIAEFTSSFPARNYDDSSSLLILVWFQEKWAMPIDKNIQKEIELLNWQELAYDYSD